MIQTGIESRVKIQDIISNQLPEFVLDESPKTVDFLKQYYISQEYQGGPVDIAENLDEYLKVDNLTPDVVVGFTTLSSNIDADDTTITVSTTKGFPNQYGLLKIDSEIITYTGLTTNTFTGCVRGFSGITSYHADLNEDELVFSTSTATSHTSGVSIQNLSSLFLKEFYRKLKSTYTPGFEDRTFDSQINVGNFIKEARSFYESKGTDDSFRILFNVLYGETPKVINLENYLIKPSDAEFIRREICVAEVISGDPAKIVGQTLAKTTDNNTIASISSVEAFTRNSKQYFKIGLFVGFSENSSVQGNFTITPSSKVLENVNVGSSVISVDSTIGFGQTGILYSGSNVITYSDKNVNQFLGCSGITDAITATDNIHSDDTYFAYEDGDTTKKVVLRLTGVLSNFVQKSENIVVSEGDILTVKNIGTLVKNPEQNKTYKEIFANSWIYNTSSSVNIDNIDGSSVTLKTTIDRSQFKRGDFVEFIDVKTNDVVFPTETSPKPYINSNIPPNSKSLSVVNTTGFLPNSSTSYKLRRKINKANSSSVPFKYGNGSIISDVQNVYLDNNDFAYVASNSLPSWGSGVDNFYTHRIPNVLKSVSISATSGSLSDLDPSTGLYTSILFDSNVPFISGERIQYTPSGAPLNGLLEGSYYVKVLSDPKKIKLFTSNSFLDSDSNAIQFDSPTTTLGTHNFILYSQKSKTINPQKIFKKFTLNPNITNGVGEETVPGSTGMLINGVEISNYKTFDKIYSGPLEKVTVLNGGSDFDVINPPILEVSAGLGTTALVQPVLTGSIQEIFVDKQDFDIKEVLSINVTGGNGSGGSFEPVTIVKRREVLFDGRATTQGGGISTITSQLTFLSNHNFTNGEEITYRNNGNENISIGLGVSALVDNKNYFAKVDNSTTIQLFNTFDDYQTNSNVISFGTTSLSGTHKFLTGSAKKTLSEVKVIDGGTFTNRKLSVKPSGISTSQNLINFIDHGFSSGEIVEYQYESGYGSIGISTENQYYVLKEDNDSFRLCDAGIGGTITTNYEQENFVEFTSTGTGFQQFKYPDIQVSAEVTTVGLGTITQVNTIVLTPIVKGEIKEIYVYEPGTRYGSDILNLEKKPSITVKNGRDAQFAPIIVNGSVDAVNLQFSGFDYFSVPEVVVHDPTGSGTGAKLRAVTSNEGKITDIKIINAGIGYSTSSTIEITASGKNQKFDSSIRSLSINHVEKLSTQQTEILEDVDNELSYSVTGYFENLRNSFQDDGSDPSGIIGWAYDGNPIYGSYAPIDPENISSDPKTMTSSYVQSASNIYDRPSISDFPLGFFVEDYRYVNGTGDLDRNNGRFAKTEEFPNGVYAYYASINPVSGKPVFPYFIGDTFRSNTLSENSTLDQTFDFNSSGLSRNTLPYKISELEADNDFIIESNEIKRQKISVESVQEGSVTSVKITNAGDNYKVGDSLTFDNSGTNGGGISAEISELKGKTINKINTEYQSYNNALFTWRNDGKVIVTIEPFHIFSDNDYVSISGFSTSTLSPLNGYFKIDVPSIATIGITTEIAGTGAATTEIYVTQIPSGISVGSTIGIGTETLEVLNLYSDKNIFRVKRGLPNTTHTVGVAITAKSNTFIIDQKLDYFDSKVNDKVYFNPRESVGVGTTAGKGYQLSYSFGQETITGSIPTQRISLDDHPFQTNQKLTFNTNGNNPIFISTSPTGTPFNLSSGETVYAVNKSPSTIGIKTSLTSDEVFFITNGSDADDYYFESNFEQKTGIVEKILSTVSISTAHGLTAGDSIALNVKPSLSVGIGTSTAVRVIRDSNTENLQINPIGFNSTGVSTATNEITISNHELETGDKVYYEANEVASGLSTGSYFVFKVDSNKIKLSETLVNSKKNPPITVSIATTGGSSQTISLINPRIESVVNNNLVFDLSDSSLSGYAFRVYYDQDFNNEFVSTGSTSIFSSVGVGTTGLSGATYTLNHSSGFPEKLYYSLEKSGYISTSDKDVDNYSEILFVDSAYNQTYPISGVGTTTFQVSLQEVPEKLSYLSTECDKLEYTTTSTSASGPANKVKLLSGGSEYKKLPVLSDVTSTNGDNLFVSLESNDIGNVLETRIINEGFEYSSDKTLQPEAFISPRIQLKNSNTIGIVTITSGGSGYITTPEIVVVNNDTRTVLNNGLIKPILTGNSITNLNIEVPPKGVSDQSAELFATSNTNGVSITKVDSSNTGIFTCTLTTPSLGFTTTPFAVNDEVFVEGIQKYSTSGDGFNSSDYGYKFFTVTNYNVGLVEDKVTLSIVGLGTNTGIAKTIQDSFGTIVSKDNYPTFSISLRSSAFEIGETLIVDDVERDLVVTGYDDSGFLKVFGSYDLSVNEVLKGKTSGNLGTIESLDEYDGMYEIKFSNRKNEGWETETGKLSEDYQIIADNDYYQNLSYSVKSKQQWKDIRTPVNSLVHSIGIKNFSDTEIISDDDDRIGISSFTNQTTIVRDIIDEKRVDTINNFDFVKDVDLVNGRSKFLKLANKKLTNFNESKSNIVLKVDNIQNQFSSFESDPFVYKNIVKVSDLGSYNNYLFKVTDVSNKNQVQLTNLVFLKNSVNENNIILEKQSLVNVGSGFTTQDGEQYGDFSLESDELGDTYLRFTPVDAFDTEYDIKYIYKKFDNSIIGIGTQSVGFIDLTSRSQVVTVGITSTIIGVATDKFTSLHVNAQVYKGVSNETNFVELYFTHDGTNASIADFYFDTEGFSRSSGLIGSFGATIDSGIVNLTFNNDTDEDVVVKTRVVGFGTTSVGVGTYRYILPNQPVGSERSAIYQSDFAGGTSAITFLTLDKNTFDASRSLVEVSIGSTKSIHQIMMVQDLSNIYVQQSSFLSLSGTDEFDTTSGIGTFGGEFSGDDVLVKFYPDASFTGNFKVHSFSECLYTSVDVLNQAPNLEYGNSIETVNTSQYFAINGDRIDKEDFVLRSNGTSIFAKKFNPADTQVLNQSTGVFSIDNHFFSNDEELVYTPGSTFVGVGSTPMMYKNGSVIAELPTQVFAVVNNDDNKFSISTTKSGTAVTFTSLGEGNSHEFAMAKRNEKAIITLDNVAQYPIAFTKISQTLAGNGGGITTTATTFALSGISTVVPLDILRIDDEYMKVINVGFGTTNVGPISNTGTEKLVNVVRGHVGSSATSHTDSTTTRIYRGSYNIVGDSIFFTKAPRGNSSITRTAGNLEFETSDFTGRVFLRSDYSTNQVYDDVSEEFSGIGRTFTLTVGGANTAGIGTTGGNGIVFINGIFQSPSTQNNPSNNFSIIEQTSPTGISSIVFSGIRTDIADPNSILVSESDVNQNQIPRGGVIISLGSTGGLGYAPLAGAAVTAVVSAGAIVGLNTGITGGTFGSGYNGIVSIGISVYENGHSGNVADISATVGAGGTLVFTINDGGSEYNNPEIFVSEPTYENLEIVGVSRIGEGATTDTGTGLLLNVNVGASSTVGVGSTYHSVNSFSIARSGYAFRKGDVFKPVGLVTAAGLSSPLSEFELTVLETYSDKFGAWQFGELDFIDSIKNYQDGSRIRFPLFYNGSILSFEKPEESTIDLQNVLLIFINGVLQEPGEAYTFDGGTSFAFSVPPKSSDKIDIFFYRGTRGLDDLQVDNVIPTLERGDNVQVFKNDTIPNTVTQDGRVVFDVSFSDKFETNLYIDQGVDEVNDRPMSWTKQKTDRVINGEFIYKTRQTTISQVYPTARIIKDVSSSDSRVFVDDVSDFTYNLGGGPYNDLKGIVVDGKEDPSPANIVADTPVGGGTIPSLTISNGGSGYVGSTVDIKFQSPPEIGVGIGTTAQATATITNGVITGTTIVNPGFGYTVAPKTIVPLPDPNYEVLGKIQNVSGFSGIITSIETTTGTGGHPLAIKFHLDRSPTAFGNDLEVGYPIFVKNTKVGSGVTTVDDSNIAVVGIGTTFLDNVYYIGAITVDGTVGIVTCNIDSGTSTSGLATSGDIVGEFSWGLFTSITRASSPISIGVTGKTVDVGLSTFPTIQRRGEGLRKTGALPETLN